MVNRNTGRFLVLSAFAALCAVVLFSTETDATGKLEGFHTIFSRVVEKPTKSPSTVYKKAEVYRPGFLKGLKNRREYGRGMRQKKSRGLANRRYGFGRRGGKGQNRNASRGNGRGRGRKYGRGRGGRRQGKGRGGRGRGRGGRGRGRGGRGRGRGGRGRGRGGRGRGRGGRGKGRGKGKRGSGEDKSSEGKGTGKGKGKGY
ncbi:uncharacterized protein LOC144625752 [Crassostrea virginica]